LTSYKKAAGGLDAITATLRHTFREAGVLRGTRALLKMNQRSGFDCAGCAWPEPSHRHIAEFCENGAKAMADMATRKLVDAGFFDRWSIDALQKQTDIWLNDQGRLTAPMVKWPGASHYVTVSWDDAFKLIAQQLNSCAHPDEAIFYTSGRASNEAAYLYQLFARHFGTNNLPDCSNMCHESSGTGMLESVGVGKGTVSLADFELADAVLVIGQNPGTNHPRMLTALQSAHRRGCQIIAVNPIREVALERFTHPQEITKLLSRGEPIATLYLQVKTGGDIALFKGLMRLVIEKDHIDPDFIEQFTSDFESYKTKLSKLSWDDILHASGLAHEEIEKCAAILSSSKRVIACWAMGLTQHEHAVGNIQEVTNLMLMLGQIGKPGAGLCPVRGHSNVQGDRTMGIWEKPSPDFLDKLKARYGFDPPYEHGHDTIGAIEAMRDRRAKVFVGLGGNFLSATPDTPITAQALQNCQLTVHIATKLNRGHLHCGDFALLLPALSRVDKDMQAHGPQFVTVEDSMSVVHASRGHITPPSRDVMSEPSIIAHMAHATLGVRSRVDWLSLAGNYDLIRDEVAAVIPHFERFNERVRKPDGFVLPNDAAQRRFETSTKKARFMWHDIARFALEPHQLLMMTIRSHDQFNTTVYSANDRYRSVKGNRHVILMNESDIGRLGFAEGDTVRITSHFKGVHRHLDGFKVTPFAIAPSCAATYFPECNALVPLGQHDMRSRTPASKSVVISLTKHVT